MQPDALNTSFQGATAQDVLHAALVERVAGELAMVSSFGAESAVLLHLIAQIRTQTPILFLDTHLLFPETLEYQRRLCDILGLTNVRVLQAKPERLAEQDPRDTLRMSDANRCCNLRKTEPLMAALSAFDGWITGRKRYQSDTRQHLKYFEQDGATKRVKLNPLAFWTPDQVDAYFVRHTLPRHPLVSRGYPSIGCAPCTSAVQKNENPRAGRWREQAKTECGIHLPQATTLTRRSPQWL